MAAAAAIQVGSYLPFDPEWSLLPTAGLFASTFLVGAVGAFFMAPELTAIRRWPVSTIHRLRWLGLVWIICTAIWFLALFTIPGIPTHCGTLGFPACGHEYVFNNHGFLTVTDRAGFMAGVRIQIRVLASPTIAVLTVLLVAYRLSDRLHLSAAARPNGSLQSNDGSGVSVGQK